MAKGLTDAAVEEFWAEVAKRRGGQASVRSFGRYLGVSGSGGLSESSGLVYLAAGSLWFESVESPKKIMGFLLSTGGEAAEPFEAGYAFGDIAGAGLVGSRDACACVRGRFGPERLKPFGFPESLFGDPAIQLKLRDGISVFIEASRHKGLLAALREAGVAIAGRR